MTTFATRLAHPVDRILRPAIFELEDRLMERRYGISARGKLEIARLTIPEGNADEGHYYTPTPVPLLRWVLREIAMPPEEFTFVDLGSGKGRMLFAAADAGYRRVVGVEFGKELHEAAEANAKRCRRDVTRVELVLGDAGEFGFPEGPFVVYFNNPFAEQVMSSVIANIGKAYAIQPRPIVIAYQQMKVDPNATGNLDLLAEVPFLSASHRTPRRGYDRFMLSQFTLALYSTPQAKALRRA